MNAVALVESEDHVCVRYRLAPYLPAQSIMPFAPNLFGRLKQYQSLDQADAVILQRTLLSAFELRALRRQTPRLIFDFDDAIWLRDSYAKNGFSRKRLRRFRRMVRLADRVVAGNDFLAEQAARFTSKTKIDVVPSCIPVEDTPARHHRSADDLTLVWIGSSSTLTSLEALRPTLAALGQAFPRLRLKLICDRFVRFDPLPVECVPWAAAMEATDIATGDIGIAVMPDDVWSRGKCGVKVLQYLAAGLPVIANPVGIHTAMVRPGETGVLAANTREWIDAVRQLQDAPLRRRLGANGRRLVADVYSTAVGRRAWHTILESFHRRQAC